MADKSTLAQSLADIPGMEKWANAIGGEASLSSGLFPGMKHARPPEAERGPQVVGVHQIAEGGGLACQK